MSKGRPTAARVALTAIMIVAALTRLVRLDLMEFKADEAEACRLALHALGYGEPGVGHFFPTAGLQASVGIPNPPLFVYLVALPLAVVRSPIAVAAAIALANVAAVLLCYVAGRRIYSSFVGVVSAALFALSPWSIVFSRKIWAQDLLPLVTTLFLLELHALLVRRKARAAATLLVLAAAGTALHYAAAVLVVVAVAALVASRELVRARMLAIAAAVTVALFVPFLALHADALGHPRPASTPPGIVHRFAIAVHMTAEVTGADGLRPLIGSQPGFAVPLALLLGATGFAGLLLAARGRLGALLVVWFMLPAALLTIVATTGYIHYFIVLLPLPFLGIALLAEQLARRSRVAALAAVAVILAYFGGNDAWLFRTVERQGGAAGDYGVAYGSKHDATAALARLSSGHAIALRGDTGPEYRFLLWNLDPDARPRAVPEARYTITDLLLAHRPPGRVTAREGPLAVSVP